LFKCRNAVSQLLGRMKFERRLPVQRTEVGRGISNIEIVPNFDKPFCFSLNFMTVCLTVQNLDLQPPQVNLISSPPVSYTILYDTVYLIVPQEKNRQRSLPLSLPKGGSKREFLHLALPFISSLQIIVDILNLILCGLNIASPRLRTTNCLWYSHICAERER